MLVFGKESSLGWEQHAIFTPLRITFLFFLQTNYYRNIKRITRVDIHIITHYIQLQPGEYSYVDIFLKLLMRLLLF